LQLLQIQPIWPTLRRRQGIRMRTVNAKEANYNSGQLIDTARAGPVTVVKYGRAVVVVLAVEEYERLRALEAATPPTPKRD
jgi:prevent-host-death family protein